MSRVTKVTIAMPTVIRLWAGTHRFGTLVVAASGDYYATLGVPKSTSGKEIKAAYRRLSRQYHPDVNKEPEATEKFKEISTAYETNPFDLYETFFGSSMGGFPGMDQAGFRTSRRSTFSKGDDIRGQVMRTEQTPFGMFSQVSVCPNCGGDGEIISKNCRKCSGKGCISVKKTIKVKVPPGFSAGSILRVAGEGDAGPKGGLPGDLYVYLDVQEIPGIQRDGINLSSMVSISYLDAILGSVIKVKTVEGVTDLQIPPGTQPGDVLVLTRKGAPKLNKPSIRGDHFFTIKVTYRIELEQELLEELASLSNSSGSRSRTHPRTQPSTKAAGSKVGAGAEKTEVTADKSFAG
ncbi:Molecular chaperone Hsp40/DnaJ family protein isoform 4 [Hibiscus syriacus]|uniref:Molecular chaperone Hsp40/DnaJ family protein isoform 4 n=1 Tax=Hibiscus syriacus TaxID=106335 RepID=A0A6A2X4S7_HIBSY|nr:Molecular chaperone Hsp40/DnaJ family protein isoform 4 [Hibiscus syriacus]